MTPQETKTRATKDGSGVSTARAGLVLLLVVIVLAVLFGAGLLPKLRQRDELRSVAQAAESDVPVVNVVTPRHAPPTQTVTLPGNVEAIQAAPVFARSSGYIRRTLASIGDKVKAGQLLAEIEAPEVEQELGQARAALNQARASLAQKRAAYKQAVANMQLAEVTLKRWKDLVAQGVFAAQSGDEKQSAFDARKADVEAAEADIQAVEANIAAQQANVRRIEELQGFEKITAQFDGVITSRPVDAGALVTAGSGSGLREIFRLAQIDTLRIYVGVPQSAVPSIRTGQSARLTVQEHPGRVFDARVVRLANALDPATRTQLTELHVANLDHTLLPGMYAQVEFQTGGSVARLLVPATVLVIRADGAYAVGVVGQNNRVLYRKLQVGRDLGSEMEVVSGLEGDERMVINPSDDLTDGTTVRVVTTKK